MTTWRRCSGRPRRFVGFASVNPAYQGVDAAVEELRRAVTELGLAGVKLYPMYLHSAVNDPELGFLIYEAAQELGIPVMIHQAGSTRIDAKLELGRPAMLDDIGREFRDLRVSSRTAGCRGSTRRCSSLRSTRTSTRSSRT